MRTEDGSWDTSWPRFDVPLQPRICIPYGKALHLGDATDPQPSWGNPGSGGAARRRVLRHRQRRGLWPRPGHRVARRAGDRRLRRAHLLYRRVLLAVLRRRLVPVDRVHGRLGLRAAARGGPAHRPALHLRALPSRRLARSPAGRGTGAGGQLARQSTARWRRMAREPTPRWWRWRRLAWSAPARPGATSAG